ncbi:hypothetical protein PF004_g1856 [Phytophthora fragariae]|uniref:Uncharacterized protein n=2 Tax=Phytophthora fragariae TaxID=53985 RepID=A0A6G0PR04_9STRA|nr:hypothetical protein PF004_g1856 [Phytophthora fragariae]
MFDGSGYRVWARQLQLYLEAKDAWGAVLKTTLTSLQLRMKSPTKLTKLATTIILSALTDAQSALITDMTHTQEILQTLQKTHRHVCDTTVGALKRQCMSLYIDAGGDMLEHIRQTRLMLAELECYKMSLSGAEKKSNFLQSLDPDWDDYIGALKECGSMEELLIKAAAEARRRSTHNHGGAQAVSSGNAFAALSRPVGPTQQDGDTV